VHVVGFEAREGERGKAREKRGELGGGKRRGEREERERAERDRDAYEIETAGTS